MALAALVTLGAAVGAAGPGPAATVRYKLGFLVRGPAWTPERGARADRIQAGHMANIRRTWQHGALLAAGPFQDGGDLRGVFVFRPGDGRLDSLMAGDSLSPRGGSSADSTRGSGPPGSARATAAWPKSTRSRGCRPGTPW